MDGHWTKTAPTSEGRYLAVFNDEAVIADVHIIYDDEAEPLGLDVWLKNPGSGLSMGIAPVSITHWWSVPLPRVPRLLR